VSLLTPAEEFQIGLRKLAELLNQNQNANGAPSQSPSKF
jgi:hypothetical protein